MNSVFNEQILAEKLSKLNNSQQCIETLSHWCIFHRSKAEQVVATWDKQFHSAEMVQKVPLLYLANDILQNSKRNGKEFVTEFWRVLPAAVKEVSEKGDDRGKNAASRLIDIWEERKVFGSHTKSFKDVMLGEELPGPWEVGRKRSHSVTIVKRDSRFIRTKLSIGGTAEKLVSAFHLVLSEHHSEDEEMTKCKSAVHRIKKMEKDVEMALKKAKDQNRMTLARELKDEENFLKQCIEKLTVVEANRVALISQLREALHEQEAELENVRTQMQVAQAQAEEAGNMRRRLDNENYIGVPKLSSTTSLAANTNSNAGQTTKKTAAAIAAEVADKLAASSSSQYIMSSVLSTFAAEEAKNAGVTKSSAASSSFPLCPVNSVSSSMLKPENPLPDPSVFMPVQPINPYQLQQASMQGQVSNSQPQYHLLPNPHSQQLLQPTGGLVSSFHYGSIPPLPPGPPPAATASYMLSPMVPLTQQQLQMTQQQPMIMGHQPSALTQQQSVPLPQPPLAPPSFRPLAPMQSPGMVYYSHPHHPQ